MGSRLVLGWGAVGRQVLSALPGEAVVVTEDRSAVEAVRGTDHHRRDDDPTDPAALEGLETPAVVFLADDRAATNLAAAAAVGERFPAVPTVAYPGTDADRSDREALAGRVDRLVEGPDAIADWLGSTAMGGSGGRVYRLRRVLDRIDGRLAVVTHDNPDPDAIGSAVALCAIARSLDVPADPCYYGEISHQENRAMVTQLDLDLRHLEPTDPIDDYGGFALVDHARPGVNDQLPEELHVDVVLDHHPPRGPVPATFYDYRVDAGATSTVLTEYLSAWGIEPPVRVATALLFGIRVDTDDFTRGAAPVDLEAAATLAPSVDTDVLERIEQPTIEGETLDTIARAIKRRTQFDDVAVANAGRIGSRDALPQAADQLLAMAGIETTLVFGFRDGVVYVSARSRAADVDLGETLRDAFDPIGSGGGHGDMAGAQLEVGILGGIETGEGRLAVEQRVEEVITDRFFEALQTRPGTPVESHRRESELLFGSEEG